MTGGSTAVTRRTREIGIRIALGVSRSAVLWLVIRDAGLLVIAGAAIGVPAALAATRLVKAFLYGIGTQDHLTIVIAALVLASVAALASFIPARRAASVDPRSYRCCRDGIPNAIPLLAGSDTAPLG